jgi:hypothetical protein
VSAPRVKPGTRTYKARFATSLYVLPIAGALLGLIGAGLALYLGQRVGTDAYAYWRATRTLLAGQNPYTVCPGCDWANFYPLPAYLVLLPFALLPPAAFHLVLAGLAGLALGVAASRRPALAPALLSAGFFACVANGPWPVLLLAGVAVPGLAVLWSCKPSLGLALFAGFPSWRAVILGGALTLASFAVMPWPLDWVHNLTLAPHVAPILRPGGVLLLAAFLRWRAPEARLVGLLALIPHTVSVGDALLLFAVCRTRWDAYGLAVLSYGAAFWAGAVIDPSMSLVEAQSVQWVPILVGCYLPALALTLRPSSSPSSSWSRGSPTSCGDAR